MTVALKPCPEGVAYDTLKPLFFPVARTEVLQWKRNTGGQGGKVLGTHCNEDQSKLRITSKIFENKGEFP